MAGPAPATPGRAGARVHLLAGASALSRVATGLDALHTDLGCPVTARRPWMETWLESYCDYRPFVVAVGDLDALDAAAVLAYARRRSVVQVVPVGAGPSDEVRLPARDPASAALLADGIADALHSIRAPWRLVVRHLPPDELVLRAVDSAMPWSVVAAGESILRLRFGDDRSLRTYVSRNHHQQVRRLHNRFRRAGFAPEVSVIHGAAAVADVLPEVERVCRERDLDLRRYTQLDDAATERFFRNLILRHAQLGEVELITMRVGSELVAYVLSFIDGETRRMWNCRFAPAWRDYGPGRLANDEALRTALADTSCTAFDWMLGSEKYKESMSNYTYDTVDLFAYSSLSLYAGYEPLRRSADALRRTKNRHESISRAWESIRPVLDARRRRTP